ncbi:hypothetical protein ACKAV7_011770 [Fusarium commune]
MDQKRIPESGFSGTSTLPLEPATLTPELYAHVKGVLLRDQNYVRRENEPRVYSKTQGEDSFVATSLWLERTQWPAIFHKSRRDILRALTQLPNNRALMVDYVLGQGPSRGDPDIEHQVWAAIDISRGFWPARTSYVESHTPLHGAQPEISGPMRWGDARPSSNEEYDAESDEDNYETSEDEDELDNGPGYMSDSGESYVEAQPRPGSQAVTESGDTVFRDFLQLLFQFCISLSTESFLDGQASSTMLIYFSGILGFSDDSR